MKDDCLMFENLSDTELLEMHRQIDKEIKDECWSHFVAYNIIDVGLVKGIDDKMQLVALALTVAYSSKIVPDEVFSQIQSWDSLIYNYLKEQNIVIPNKKHNHRSQFEGAYVKDPITGKHKWIVSFDLQSLYPHLMMWANISPETITSTVLNVNVEGLLAKKYNLDDLVANNLSMTANGITYRKDIHGFIPKLMDKIYKDRAVAKKKMLEAEQRIEVINAELARRNVGGHK